MTRRQSVRIKKTRVNLADRLAAQLMPAAQCARKDYELCDVANHADADQRHMQRSGEKQTIRKLTRIDKLKARGVLCQRGAQACEWYQGQYENQYETRVKIANWAATGGASDRAYGHWPAGAFLDQQQTMFDYARAGIPPIPRMVLDRVVLHGRPIGKLSLTLRLAVRLLLERIEGEVAL